MIERYVLGLEEIDKTQVALVGGKGAHLGELSRIEGIRVPAGFCVTTDAFRRIMTTVPWIDDQLDRLARLDPDDRQEIRTVSAEMRRTLEGIAILPAMNRHRKLEHVDGVVAHHVREHRPLGHRLRRDALEAFLDGFAEMVEHFLALAPPRRLDRESQVEG